MLTLTESAPNCQEQDQVKEKATELSITVDDVDFDFTAGIVAIVMFGESEGDRDLAHVLLQGHLVNIDLTDELLEMMEGFDPNQND